jgi:hypothetical protein
VLTSIDDLPDDVLIQIFDFYVVRYRNPDFTRTVFISHRDTKKKIESWQSLVHVCRRWRGLVFASPRRLNLQTYWYTPGRRARKSLDVWPAWSLFVSGSVFDELDVAVLEHSDRISQIDFHCSTTFKAASHIENFWTAMQVPFPELVGLRLSCTPISYGSRAYKAVLPDSFLGGSAPRLRYFCLNAIPFPGFPKLLSSATHLAHLRLIKIPHSGYISPEALATCLSMLSSLERFEFGFESPRSHPGLKSRRSFPPTRFVLPTLTVFWFEGVSEYLEEFVAWIDAPQLHRLLTTLFVYTGFKAPELTQFISRTPTLGPYDEAHLNFDSNDAQVRLHRSHSEPSDHGKVQVRLLILRSDQQLSSMAQI